MLICSLFFRCGGDFLPIVFCVLIKKSPFLMALSDESLVVVKEFRQKIMSVIVQFWLNFSVVPIVSFTSYPTLVFAILAIFAS